MGCCQSKDTKKPKEEARKAPEAKRQEPVARRAALDEKRELSGKAAAHADESVDPRVERIHALRAYQEKCPFRYDACTVRGGEVKKYFENGIVFRIIKGDSWFIYNDSLDYEAQVDFRLGPGSKISAGERTTLEETEDGWICAHAVVYPLETLHYISGSVNGYKSGITIKPLSDEYRHDMAKVANEIAENETAAVQELAGEETDEEEVLRRCVRTRTPYVDLHFPPHAHSLARPELDVRTFPEMAFMRPTQYLSGNKRASPDAVVGPVVSQSIDCGSLGDSWLVCALAALAEKPSTVEQLFMHSTPAEKAVGAYRVSLNKNGWWNSVIVDDYLPTVNKTPVFARSFDQPRELWIPLLEKAYAKVHGSFATITGGDALQALTDFTGSPVFRFDVDWASAAINATKAAAFAELLIHLTRHSAATVMLSTPSHDSETYLGREAQVDPRAFREKFAEVGLRTGYTYFVENVVAFEKRRTLLFKVRNPWRSTGRWTGRWCYGSPAWKENPEVCSACNGLVDPKDGSFWIEFEDAKKYFDGGGVIMTLSASTDYRVKGCFEDTVPSAVLDITVAEPVRVLLTLSQPDKRGFDRKNPACRFAPIMLTLSKQDGDKQRVMQNTSWNPLQPADEFNFAVSRDVGMWATLQPGERYHVVPRIHRKGVKTDYSRPYVIGIIAEAPLDGKVHIEAKHIPADSSVFTNYVAYAATDLASVDVEHQVHTAGAPLQCSVSATVVAAAAAAVRSPPAKSDPSPVRSGSDVSGDAIQRVANVPNPGDADDDSQL
ncbi:putative Cytoskeleton-associated protein CAP55 [Leptomonas seymouri]|uniref:Putative Cytoskeleton-associated protein CAP55 n=1 Tax=Leptomonas seymouri TaxID=5684 RepID=A0A0N1PFI4_LEPSE|nr:putative Cytoskeleton-associated protein CAP55 [Leptomonas seymouri]|eukprot:KPI90320.1 putative Cytoskeleton-associated protein CAP55 [Leptomonas seymouri]